MGTAERRQREALRRRQMILDVARRVFREKGYAGATVPLIAKEAELAPGTIYLYFPGKDALYAELLTEGYEILQQRLEEAAASGDAEQAAARLIDVFFDFAREYPEYFEMIFFILQKEGDVGWQGFPEEQVARLAAWEAACRAVVAGVLAQIQSRSPERCERTVQALWTMLAGVVFYMRGRPEFMSVAREAKALLLTAVLGSQGK
jgi:AcrR family transcriptional regulator